MTFSFKPFDYISFNENYQKYKQRIYQTTNFSSTQYAVTHAPTAPKKSAGVPFKQYMFNLKK